MRNITDAQIDAALNREMNAAMSDVQGRPIHSAIIDAVRRQLQGVSEDRVRERLHEMLYGGDDSVY